MLISIELEGLVAHVPDLSRHTSCLHLKCISSYVFKTVCFKSGSWGPKWRRIRTGIQLFLYLAPHPRNHGLKSNMPILTFLERKFKELRKCILPPRCIVVELCHFLLNGVATPQNRVYPLSLNQRNTAILHGMN